MLAPFAFYARLLAVGELDPAASKAGQPAKYGMEFVSR